MKRTPARGGFWQPLTGKVEPGETLEAAITREAREETGIADIVRIIDTGYSFTFSDEKHSNTEYIYGALIKGDKEIKLSHEHSEYKWVNKSEALNLLQWKENKEGLERLADLLETESN